MKAHRLKTASLTFSKDHKICSQALLISSLINPLSSNNIFCLISAKTGGLCTVALKCKENGKSDKKKKGNSQNVTANNKTLTNHKTALVRLKLERVGNYSTILSPHWMDSIWKAFASGKLLQCCSSG